MVALLSPDTVLPALGLVALLLLLTGLWLGRPDPTRPSPSDLLPSFALLALAIAISALRPPFGPAGVGLVAGGALGLLLCWSSHPTAQAAAAALAGLVVASADAPLTRAAGLAVGLWLAGWPILLPRLLDDREEPLAVGLLAATATAIGAGLGAERESGLLAWLAPAVMLAAGIAAALAAPSEARDGEWPLALALPAAAVTMALAGMALGTEPAAWLPALLGLAAVALLASLPGRGGDRLRDGLLTAGVAVLSGAAAFALGRGLGLGVAAAAFTGSSLMFDRRATRGGACLLVTWLLFRLCYERVPLGAGRADLYLNTTLIGLVLGQLAPLAAGLTVERWPGSRPGGQAARLELAVTTLTALALPSLVAVLLWGPRAAAGVIAGAFGAGAMLVAWQPATQGQSERGQRWWSLMPLAATALAALAVPLITAVGAPELTPRPVKTAVLAAVLLLVLVYARLRPAPAEER